MRFVIEKNTTFASRMSGRPQQICIRLPTRLTRTNTLNAKHGVEGIRAAAAAV
jgi:hypothetical protein